MKPHRRERNVGTIGCPSIRPLLFRVTQGILNKISSAHPGSLIWKDNFRNPPEYHDNALGRAKEATQMKCHQVLATATHHIARKSQSLSTEAMKACVWNEWKRDSSIVRKFTLLSISGRPAEEVALFWSGVKNALSSDWKVNWKAILAKATIKKWGTRKVERTRRYFNQAVSSCLLNVPTKALFFSSKLWSNLTFQLSLEREGDGIKKIFQVKAIFFHSEKEG